MKPKLFPVARLRLHEAYQFLVLTKQSQRNSSSKIKIYSKYDVSGRLQNDSPGGPQIKNENLSKDLKVDGPKKAARVNGSDDSGVKTKGGDARLEEEQWELKSIIRRGNGKKTTKKALKDNRRGNLIKKVKFE